ncbi:site-specific integrase [Sphingomonas nostoxanthinifaciens]|uniref:site-specific integrase n=1 Tax=Sphingomonas nostoxanthinifaciens TaxID=2872652 RepID=UPI001CC1C72E|nr:site-specific integrase [Sphingomonas nostoxanthinifaciens]UAK25744.1 site-specific integrase [Sphingomonas nostoxanthinifaciens]
MCTYLDKVGSTYYFKKGVPQDLVGHFRTKTGGVREVWKISLGTKDREVAKRLIPAHTIEIERQIVEAQAVIAGNAREAPETVSQKQTDADAAIIREEQERASAINAELVEVARAAEVRRQARREARQRMREEMEEHARRFSTADLPPFHAILKDIMEEREEVAEAFQARSPLPDYATPQTGRFASRRRTRQSDRGDEQQQVPLLEIFDAYAAEQKIKPATRIGWRAHMVGLIEFLGHDDAARMTTDDLYRWVDQLLSETTKRGTKRNARTVKGSYLAAVNATLGWAVGRRKLKENVASSVVVRVPRQAKLRDRNFTTAEAQAILAATLLAQDGITAETVLARRWIPWLCAYTGARVNEMSQLRGADVQEIEGIWTIRITPEAGTVKANAARIVPLHPHLIEQGFPAVAKATGDGPLFYNPGRRRVEREGNRHFKKVGERLAAWVREDVGITDTGLQPNHGWRHTFKTLAMATEMPERIADAIQGHSAKSIGRTYGSVPLKTMADAIGRIPRFPVKTVGASSGEVLSPATRADLDAD